MSESVAKKYKSHVEFASCAGHISSSSVYVLVFLRVERKFFLSRCMWPFIVAVDVGRCLLTASTVSPGTPNN